MFNKQKDDETSVWISNTDLMSGLLVLFLFISIIMTQNLSAANQRFKNVTQKSIQFKHCLLYTSPSPRDRTRSRMPSSA